MIDIFLSRSSSRRRSSSCSQHQVISKGPITNRQAVSTLEGYDRQAGLGAHLGVLPLSDVESWQERGQEAVLQVFLWETKETYSNSSQSTPTVGETNYVAFVDIANCTATCIAEAAWCCVC